MKTHDIPEWADKVRKAGLSGRNVAVVHFNVEDEFVYKGGIVSVKEVISDVLDKKGYVQYNLSGLTFSDDETELTFRSITGLPCPPEDPGPIPEDASDVQAAIHFEAQQDYLKWVEAKKEAEKVGRNPLTLLPIIDAKEIDKICGALSAFMDFNPPEDAVREDGTHYPRANDYAIVIDYASMIVPAGDTSSTAMAQKVLETYLLGWSELGANFSPIILYAPSLVDISKTLYGRGSQIATIEVPYPSYEERYRYLKELQKLVSFKLNGATYEELARLASGLSNRHLKALARESWAESRPIDAKGVRDYKQQALSDELAGLVEVVIPDHGFETIGGMEDVKAELDKISEYINSDKETLVPMGILLTGPPGTGKTYLAEGFAKNVGFNFIKMGTVKSKWVGESERNLAKVFQIAKALAPVVIFVDEIDQEGSRSESDGDSGVSKHIFGAILRFMSDTSLRGKVLWIAATNRPDLMDPAMKRPGRFDIRIPLLYPDTDERSAIFQVMFTKYDLTPSKNVNYRALSEMATDFSGADIEAVVLEAARYSDADGEPSVSQKNLVDALDDYIVHYDRDAIKDMEKVALSECNSIRLLPPRYRDKARTKKGSVKVQTKEV